MFRRKQQLQRLSNFSPLDWGLNVALVQWKKLLVFAIPVFLVDIVGGYLLYTQPLTPRLWFLVSVLNYGAGAWLVATVLTMSVRIMKNEYVGLREIGLHSFQYLPKVFLSYVVFSMMGDVGGQVHPALIIVLFFIWAPFFCVGENLIEPSEDLDTKVVDEDEDEDREEEFSLRPEVSFSRSGLLDLGGLRSIQLVSSQFSRTFPIIIVFWLALIGPGTLVHIWFAPYTTLLEHLLDYFVSTIGLVFSVAVLSGAFLRMLSASQLEELDLRATSFHSRLLEGRRPLLSFGSRVAPIAFMAFLALSCTFYRIESSRTVETMPPSATIDVSNAVQDGDQVVVEILLSDVEQQHRWLDVMRFRVAYHESGTTYLMVPQILSIEQKYRENRQSGKKKEEQKFEFYAKPIAHRVLIADDLGHALVPDFFKPHYGPITLVLRFQVPDRYLRGSYYYSLFYVPDDGDISSLIYTGILLNE